MACVRTVDEFMALYPSYYPKIFSFFYRELSHRENSEDLTAATFTKALQALQKGGVEIMNFNAWIYRIATNELLSHLNTKKRRQNHEIGVSATEMSDFLPDGKYDPESYSDFIDLRDTIQSLKTQERILIQMRYFDKMEYSEMAQVLGMKEVTIRSKLHRTLKKMNRLMGGHENG
jgi:RNA polymerase sigma-70 factor (ECF subfamily)